MLRGNLATIHGYQMLRYEPKELLLINTAEEIKAIALPNLPAKIKPGKLVRGLPTPPTSSCCTTQGTPAAVGGFGRGKAERGLMIDGGRVAPNTIFPYG
jgi:hypothetical protein